MWTTYSDESQFDILVHTRPLAKEKVLNDEYLGQLVDLELVSNGFGFFLSDI